MQGIFENPREFHYEKGALLVGMDYDKATQNSRPIGVKTERHAMTFAGSGSGKGAAVLIPNAKLWRDNLLVVDPKGEVGGAKLLRGH